jgi:tetratricopeptide (TPR) repeat protein
MTSKVSAILILAYAFFGQSSITLAQVARLGPYEVMNNRPITLDRIGVAQPGTSNGPSAFSDTSSAQVSAQTLRVPRKAMKAFNTGTKLLTANNASASIPEFQKAIKAFPDYYEAYYNMGVANLDLGNLGDAEKAFNRSVELSKGLYPRPHFSLGLTLALQKRYSEAKEVIQRGLDLDNKDAVGHCAMALVFIGEARLPEAEKSAQRAVLSNANFATGHLLLALIHARQNEITAVVADLDQYLRLVPNGPHNEEARALRARAEQLLGQQNGNSSPLVAREHRP